MERKMTNRVVKKEEKRREGGRVSGVKGRRG